MNKRPACKINGLKYPVADQISGRTSTICRSMACTMLSRIPCAPTQEEQWLKFFPDKTCAYCGKKATHLDHLHALIIDRIPTGYGTEAANLVPCCVECNQPKGNLYWEDFMRSNLCHHVGDSHTSDIQQAMEYRIENIKQFQKAMPPQKVIIDATILAKWDALLLDFVIKTKRSAGDSLGDKRAAVYIIISGYYVE